MQIDKYVEEVLQWFADTPEKEQLLFKNTPKEQLVMYHDTLGRDIRNHFKLWEIKWDTDIVDGIDMSAEHPDAVSMRIIEEVWKKCAEISLSG